MRNIYALRFLIVSSVSSKDARRTAGFMTGVMDKCNIMVGVF